MAAVVVPTEVTVAEKLRTPVKKGNLARKAVMGKAAMGQAQF